MKALPSSPTVELERTRRMAQCWREHVPSDFEVEMAHCRLRARSAPTRDTTRTTHAVIFGLVLALSSMVPLMQTREPVLPSGPLETASSGVPSVRETSLAAPPRAAVDNAPRAESAPVLSVKSGSRPARRAPRASIRRHHSAEKDRMVVAVAAPEVSFAHVADAGFRPDPLTRDVAALSRAYLLVSDGRAERARDMLERLADRGATAGIRKRASELLMRTVEPPPSSLLFLVQRSSGLG